MEKQKQVKEAKRNKRIDTDINTEKIEEKPEISEIIEESKEGEGESEISGIIEESKEGEPLNGKKRKNRKKEKNKVVKLANVLFTFSVIALILSGLVVFSTLTLILYYLILVIILIITLFTLYKHILPWFEGGERIHPFLEVAYQALPYIVAFGMATGLASLIIYITQKNYIHRTSKIITLSVFLVLYIIVLILRFAVFNYSEV